MCSARESHPTATSALGGPSQALKLALAHFVPVATRLAWWPLFFRGLSKRGCEDLLEVFQADTECCGFLSEDYQRSVLVWQTKGATWRDDANRGREKELQNTCCKEGPCTWPGRSCPSSVSCVAGWTSTATMTRALRLEPRQCC